MIARMPLVAARQSIADVFASRGKGIALMPFVPAGYPNLAATEAILPALQAGGASLLEVGFPFSDPVADGPTIQAAYTDALAHKIRVADVMASIARVRDQLTIPIVAMLSYSIVFRYGVKKFAEDARACGIDGLILPDLPPPEAEAIVSVIQAAGLETVLLVAPTTTPQRRKEIARLSSGFIYYLSISGITGERANLPADLAAGVAAMKAITDKPVCVGFGISTADHVKQLLGVADGAIVGSALVRRMAAHRDEGAPAIAAACRVYCSELLAKVR